MVDAQYEQLNVMERENFKKIVNQLLGKTFIVNNKYDVAQRRTVTNPDYRFIERNIDLFREYLEYGGWNLHRENNYEVMYVTSQYGFNRAHFDKNTTIILYGLRLLYDEQRENIHLTEQIVVKVSDIVATLIEVGAYSKKPSSNDLKAALRTIASFNLIQKVDGGFEEPETKIILLPSLLFAITSDNITKISNNIKEAEDKQEEEILTGEDVE